MRAREFAKNQWQVLVSDEDKLELGQDLVDLVQTAYASTPLGSFVTSIQQVLPSDWHVLDWDQDPDVDCTVFYRGPRPGESWHGYKIQGIGHDGNPVSRRRVVDRVQQLLARPGWWIETSDAMRTVLMRGNLEPVTDVKVLQRLFGDPRLRMISADTYQRRLSDGSRIRETVFGRPLF